MIKLTNPLNHGGRVIPAGTVINLTPEMEKALIANANAVAAGAEEATPEAEVVPEGVTPLDEAHEPATTKQKRR